MKIAKLSKSHLSRGKRGGDGEVKQVDFGQPLLDLNSSPWFIFGGGGTRRFQEGGVKQNT